MMGLNRQNLCIWSQNSIADCVNCMLVELAHVMLHGQEMPEFLWEYAVSHLVYICNHSYMRALKRATLYQSNPEKLAGFAKTISDLTILSLTLKMRI